MDNKGQSSWGNIYMLIIAAIVAIVVLSYGKRLFQTSQKIVMGEEEVAK